MQHILCLRYLGTVLIAAVLITLSRIVPGTGVLNRQGSRTRSESVTTAACLDTSVVTVKSQEKLQCYHCAGPHRAAKCPKPRSRSQSRDRPGSQPRDRSQQRGPSQKQEQQRSGFTPERRPRVTSQHTVRSQRGNTPERRPSSASQLGRGAERRTSSAHRGSPSPTSSPEYQNCQGGQFLGESHVTHRLRQLAAAWCPWQPVPHS